MKPILITRSFKIKRATALSLFAIANTLDIMSTNWFLHQGIHEGNPLVKWLIYKLGNDYWVPKFFFVLIVTILWINYKELPMWPIVLGTIFFVVITLINTA